MHRVRIVFSLCLLFMIVGLVFIERSVDHVRSGSTFQDRAYDWLPALGLFVLLVSVLVTIYWSRKLVLASAAVAGALVVPEIAWTAAGVVFLFVSGIRIILEKARG